MPAPAVRIGIAKYFPVRRESSECRQRELLLRDRYDCNFERRRRAKRFQLAVASSERDRLNGPSTGTAIEFSSVAMPPVSSGSRRCAPALLRSDFNVPHFIA